jgi:hypothetical protein
MMGGGPGISGDGGDHHHGHVETGYSHNHSHKDRGADRRTPTNHHPSLRPEDS